MNNPKIQNCGVMIVVPMSIWQFYFSLKTSISGNHKPQLFSHNFYHLRTLMDGWIDGWMDVCMNGYMDVWMDLYVIL